MLKKKKKTRTR